MSLVNSSCHRCPGMKHFGSKKNLNDATEIKKNLAFICGGKLFIKMYSLERDCTVIFPNVKI